MVVLLEEDQAERKSLEKLSTQSDTLSFSDGSLQLNTELPFLYGTKSNQRNSFCFCFLLVSRCILIASLLVVTCPLWLQYLRQFFRLDVHVLSCQLQIARLECCTSPRSKSTPCCQFTCPRLNPAPSILTAVP